MLADLTQSKNDLRNQLSQRLGTQSNRKITIASERVCTRLSEKYQLFCSGYVAFYAATGGELRLDNFRREAFHRGAKIFYPRFNDVQEQYELAAVLTSDRVLVVGKFGISEPDSMAPSIDEEIRKNQIVWLVPGVAFDQLGNRLGRGYGYYDRLLADTNGVKIGVAFEWQVVKNIPADTGDIPVDYVVTDRRIIRCSR